MAAIVNLESMAGTDVQAFLQSVQATTDLDNGSLIVLGGLVSGQQDVRVATAPTDVKTEEVLLVHSPEIIEVNGLRVNLTDPSQFTNPKNRPARAWRLNVGDRFTITDDGITGTTVVDQFVVPKNGTTKPEVAADLTGGTKVAFKVLSKTNISTGSVRKAATRLEVVRA